MDPSPAALSGPRWRPAARPAFAGLLTRATALPLALALWSLETIGDYLTTAEVGFTLLYLIPIAIAVWWRGLRTGLVLCGLATTSFIVTWLATTRPGWHYWPFLWNIAGDVGVFVAFTFLLDRLRERLELEVSQRESAVEQLRHADRLNTVGKLASGLAHELGTPLYVVAGRASLIASRRVAGDEACKSAEVIVQQTERMTAIIRNLLSFARRGGARKSPLDLTRLVRETVTLLEPLAKKQGVAIHVMNGTPHVAPVNAGELQQVLTNLVMNAVQAMPKGGAVRVTLEQGPVSTGPGRAARSGTPYARIRVKDEGTGIAPDVLPHIFDPFFTTKDVGDGTGLGLSVTFGIIRDHGGWIEASSTLGEGAEFVVFLPQNDDTPSSSEAAVS
jgi:signal transduction histidine kinase